MFSWLADTFCKLAYGQTMAETVARATDKINQETERIRVNRDPIYPGCPMTNEALEAIKMDYLERGHHRGKAAMREGSIFDLYLFRADPETVTEHRDSQGAMIQNRGSGPKYRWWAVVNGAIDGAEACLGPLEELTPEKALEKYLALLEDEQLSKLGLSRETLQLRGRSQR